MSTTDKPQIFGFRTDNRTEQTRFHFHMDLCVGCHACEVACAEQNGLSPDALWRRVGEVEAGEFPDTQRFFLSSGCNHCLDAPCMKGCPVDAYSVNDKGIVVHSADACIGCQYCTWNCPYSVPTFQPERGVVSKCDLCTNRLDQNLQPACAEACPAGAIQIETVPLEEVAATYASAGVAPDMPSPEISKPSTRFTLPADMDPAAFTKVDRDFVEPEHPHTPLVWMTVLTQMGLGGMAAVYGVDLWGHLMGYTDSAAIGWTAVAVIAVAGLSLGASLLHLGRPAFAFRAARNWRTSWLSREVLGLSLFAKLAAAYAGLLLLSHSLGLLPPAWADSRLGLGAAAVLAGIAGVYASARIYLVPARPAWNQPKTLVDFFTPALVLGPAILVAALALSQPPGTSMTPFLKACSLTAALVAAAALALSRLVHGLYLRRWAASDVFELTATAGLYRRFAGRARVNDVLALIGLIALVASTVFPLAAVPALATLLPYFLLQRYLFFVTVVGTNIPGNYLVKAHQALKA